MFVRMVMIHNYTCTVTGYEKYDYKGLRLKSANFFLVSADNYYDVSISICAIIISYIYLLWVKSY